jgi:hypothetical protein
MCSVRRCLGRLIHTTPGTTTPGCPCRPHSPPRRYALLPSLASLSACTACARSALPPGHPHSEIVRPRPAPVPRAAHPHRTQQHRALSPSLPLPAPHARSNARCILPSALPSAHPHPGMSTSHLRTSALGGALTHRAWAGVDKSGTKDGEGTYPGAARAAAPTQGGWSKEPRGRRRGRRGRRRLCDVVPHLCRAPPAAAGHRVWR